MSRDVNGINGVNGVNGDHRPQTPNGNGNGSGNGMALTEYSTNPTTPSEEKRRRIRAVVPEEFLQEDGYPDVSLADWRREERSTPNCEYKLTGVWSG